MATKQTGKPWTDNEIQVVLAAYFRMLLWQEMGLEYSKTDVRRAIKERLPSRSDKSIDLKWCNVSAVLSEHHLPWVAGLKPLSHLQASLRSAVDEWLSPEFLRP